MNNDHAPYFTTVKRVVIKIGSGVLTEKNGLNLNVIKSISQQISILIDRGIEVILVSSGAMASGTKKIGLLQRPVDIPGRQAVAAVGQAGLIMEYEKSFKTHGKKVAQILLTREDLSSRKRYLNARNTLNTLLSWQVLPIINENDTVAVEEIRFGDNDNLAAMISLLLDADLLISLTDIDGLYDSDPRSNPAARLIPVINKITRKTELLASEIPGALGAGGMLSKIKAAKKVTGAGIPMIIVKGEKEDILIKLFSSEKHGTFFTPKEKKLASRKSWIAYTIKPAGVINIDDGAAEAIQNMGKSLLPCGIVDIEGDFGVGAAVRLQASGKVLGTGLVNYSASDIRNIMGRKTCDILHPTGGKPYNEVVHRDNLVLTPE